MQIKTFVFNPIQENTYVVYDETKECIVIDAGCFFPQEEIALSNFIDSNGLKLKRVINTHLHFDHAFGNAFLADRYGVKPEAHQADEFLISAMSEQARRFGFQYQIKEQGLGSYLNDGDTVSFGHTKLRALHVPGHSPGSLCFYNEAADVLFSGDVLFLESIGRTDLAGGNFNVLISGITKKLLPLPSATVVYSGHGETTTIAHEKQFNPYL